MAITTSRTIGGVKYDVDALGVFEYELWGKGSGEPNMIAHFNAYDDKSAGIIVRAIIKELVKNGIAPEDYKERDTFKLKALYEESK
jgi:hypothetical protein